MCQWEMRWEGIFSDKAQWIQGLKRKKIFHAMPWHPDLGASHAILKSVSELTNISQQASDMVKTLSCFKSVTFQINAEDSTKMWTCLLFRVIGIEHSLTFYFVEKKKKMYMHHCITAPDTAWIFSSGKIVSSHTFIPIMCWQNGHLYYRDNDVRLQQVTFIFLNKSLAGRGGDICMSLRHWNNEGS